jgi:hypothetical protein
MFTPYTFQRGRPVVPGSNIALLTKPSKMPGYSWSLPAGNVNSGHPEGTCPFAVFGQDADGNPAMCNGCYADPDSVKLSKKGKPMRRGGSYGYPNTVAAQKARRDWLFLCLSSKEGRDEWVTTMVEAIRWATRTARGTGSGRSRRIPYFRWHDSGDISNPRYAEMVRDVCAALPDVRFWLPTRSYHGGAVRRILPVLQTINALPNAAVRPSALYINVAPPVVDGLSAGTGAAATGYNCPSSRQGGECRECRTCWTKATPVVYRLH